MLSLLPVDHARFVLIALAITATLIPTIDAAPTPTPGKLDLAFAPVPGANDTVNAVVPQLDGKVIIAGRFTAVNGIARNRIARLNANGSVDTSFNPGIGPDGEILTAVLQRDGRVVVAGPFTTFAGFSRHRIARLNANGTVDPTFGFSQGINNVPHTLALQSDGRVLVGGQFSQVDLVQRFNFARLNINGTVDMTFDPGNGPNGDINAIAIQPDNRIVIGGTFTGYNGFARGGVARVLTNGALDQTFDSGVGTGGNVFAVALQRNGQIIIGGRFIQYAGVNRTFIARVNFNGSLDLSFNAIPNDWVQSIVIQSDDRAVIGGLFTGVNGFSRNRIARLNGNGALDLAFDAGAGLTGTLSNDATQVRSLALQRFGRMVVGGVFTGYDTAVRHNVARVFADGAANLANISARAHVFTGERVLIGGFIIEGTQNKAVLIRGIGPSLTLYGIVAPLADPTLRLHNQAGAVITANDNWKSTQQAQIAATGRAPPNDAESAILATLAPGAYTAVLEGKAMTTGTALVEVYDLDPTANAGLTNLSARGFVGTGDDVLIGGTIIAGDNGSVTRLLIRVLGPSLVGAGIAMPLNDPKLSLRDGNGNVIATNDNWKDTQQAAIAATGLSPSDNREAALIAQLGPGSYTAIVTGKASTTGVALVEFYDLP